MDQFLSYVVQWRAIHENHYSTSRLNDWRVTASGKEAAKGLDKEVNSRDNASSSVTSVKTSPANNGRDLETAAVQWSRYEF